MEILYALIIAALAILVIAVGKRRRRTRISEDPNNELAYNKEAETVTGPLVYPGEKLEFTDELIRRVLIRHFPFFTKLVAPDQDKFIVRVKKFMKTKIFVVHDIKAYREMPILLSASAVQITFGLEKFLLPHYAIIRIYPQEFVAMEPMRVLIGNVSGNTINIAWKQFLEGYRNRVDNNNVGLHEMAHALYFQNCETDEYIDHNFKVSFHLFTGFGDKIFEREKHTTMGLYSDYAMRNFQEFWAESMEIFFETPDRLHTQYPELYTILCDLLCQDPLRYPHHNYSV
jgi:Mlc titration factor MtfA (ptsG expression regulator)